MGSSAWFAWLESATTFAFTSASGRFTARKEARTRGGLYWKAYHTANRTLHRAYLGKSTDLTLDHLTHTAATLLAASAFPSPPTSAKPAPRPASPIPLTNLLTTKLNVPQARAQLVVRPTPVRAVERGPSPQADPRRCPGGLRNRHTLTPISSISQHCSLCKPLLSYNLSNV